MPNTRSVFLYSDEYFTQYNTTYEEYNNFREAHILNPQTEELKEILGPDNWEAPVIAKNYVTNAFSVGIEYNIKSFAKTNVGKYNDVNINQFHRMYFDFFPLGFVNSPYIEDSEGNRDDIIFRDKVARTGYRIGIMSYLPVGKEKSHFTIAFEAGNLPGLRTVYSDNDVFSARSFMFLRLGYTFDVLKKTSFTEDDDIDFDLVY